MDVEEDADVRVDGRSVRPLAAKTYLKVYKPVGIVCTADPREKNNVIDYIHSPVRLTYAGRLDRNSEGLLLMTNDGDLIEELMRSRNAHEKEYEVTVSRRIAPEELRQMRKGLYLKELGRTTRPCTIEPVSETMYRFVLTEGLNRQIRRMCEYMGIGVRKLKRVRIATLRLGDLPPGRWRELTEQERLELFRAVGKQDPSAKAEER